MKTTLTTLAASLACLMIATPAIAADAATPQKSVHFNELNLQSPAGVQELYARLHAAARQVCAAQDGRSLREAFAYRQCVEASLERAVRDVRNDAVLALHNDRSAAARRS